MISTYVFSIVWGLQWIGLDCWITSHIFEPCHYCISIQSQSNASIDAFVSMHFLENDKLLIAINKAIIANDKHAKTEQNKHKLVTAALLTILPFVNCSSKMIDLICAKYTHSQSTHSESHICNGLVFALSFTENIISLQCKTWIMSTLTHIIETQHSLQISSKIKDAYHGLVKYCIQILQCNNMRQFNLNICDIFKIKQYAIRYVCDIFIFQTMATLF